VDGKVAYARGYGLADGSGRPVTANTPFILGSTSKQFTGIAVEQLIRNGRLDLDAPVARYLPWFGSGSDPHAQVTIRELLSHTSGLSTYVGREDLANDGGPDDTLEANARRVAATPLGSPLGSRFEYSNDNYDLVGYLVEVRSGQSYGDYMRQHVFAPLGLSETFASKTEAEAAGLAAGFYPWFGLMSLPTPMPYPHGSIPSGYLISSARDLATVVLAQLGHVPGGQSDIDAALLEATRAPLATVDEYSHYAAGWFVHRFWLDTTWGQDDPALPLVYSHAGETPSSRSFMAFVPEQDFGLVMTMNMTDGTVGSRWDALSDGVIRLALGRAPLPAVTLEDPLTQNAKVAYVLALVVQLVASVWALRARRRRRLAIATAAIVNLAALGLALMYAPASAGTPLRVILRNNPDMGLATMAGMAVAICWFVLQLRQAYRARRRAAARTSTA
jgi:CubicO group peptidase (beta-lactamase class C family)